MDEFAMKWEKKRKMGKKKYIMWYGVIYVGMSITLLLSIIDFYFNGTVSIVYLLGRILIFPTIGSVIADRRWEKMEKKYSMHHALKGTTV
ncbi:hypothetical protein [Cohnella abietis]|uniref:Uncharacterized protein n=1 Tax=Cohnella abietis TaxID=2507935 RepID=A0A3T1D7M8_9BACL|nr:hypothetical protein [Cohnella abietis]BBI34090.1 hypothetical protein KCTCHS21_34890 [Cohnella abietis]